MNPAADRYAGALFEIARQMQSDHEVEAELLSLSSALKKSPELFKFLNNPRFKIQDKKKLVGRLYAKDKPPMLNFLSILFEKNRFNLIHDIAVSFKKIADVAQGQTFAQIRTAVPLGAKDEQAIISKLEKMTGFKISTEKSVDPSLLGGVVVTIQNKILDGSVKGRIKNLKEELLRGR